MDYEHFMLIFRFCGGLLVIVGALSISLTGIHVIMGMIHGMLKP